MSKFNEYLEAAKYNAKGYLKAVKDAAEEINKLDPDMHEDDLDQEVFDLAANIVNKFDLEEQGKDEGHVYDDIIAKAEKLKGKK